MIKLGNGFSLVELMLVILIVFVACSGIVQAGDKGPQQVSAALALGAGSIVPPTGDTGRFTPSHLIINAPAGTTQTVSGVYGAVTNTFGTKVIAANDNVYVFTNAPPLFAGDLVRIASSTAAGTNTARMVGNLWD